MAYFDSAKNRTLWKAELDQLRREKMRRQQHGFQSNAEGTQAMEEENNPHRIRITFRQLEEELNAKRKQSTEQRMHVEERTRSAEHSLSGV